MGAKHSRQNLIPNDSSKRRASMRTTQTNTNNTNNTGSNNNNIHTTSNSGVSHSTNSIIIEGRQYHQLDTSTYCLPRDELEQDRLNSQHFSLKALLEGNLLPTISTLLPRKAKVLDLGCGSGCWVMEMAIDHPEFEMTGVDMADMFPTTIRPENVKFELLNILDGLPYPDNTFDFVHMRLMIIAFRSTEWPLVLKEIFRVLKPGGLVQLVESDFTEKTNLQIVETFNGEFYKAMQEAGQDPWIGSKLSSLLTDIDFDVLDVQEKYLSYALPLNPIAREMLFNWRNALISIKHLLAHRLSANTDLYPTIVDRYMEGITQAGWKVKVWAIAAQKKREDTTINQQLE